MGLMSSASWPDHLLTLDEWDALPEDEFRGAELVKGTLVMAAAPVYRHQRAVGRLAAMLDEQLPDDLTAVASVGVVVDPKFPPTARIPDISILPWARAEQPRFEAEHVLLAVEILSPSTRRTDRIVKAAEYASAGIPHYWIVELGPPITLTGFLLVDGAYDEVVRTTGTVETSVPAPVRIDVSTLLDRR